MEGVQKMKSMSSQTEDQCDKSENTSVMTQTVETNSIFTNGKRFKALMQQAEKFSQAKTGVNFTKRVQTPQYMHY